MKIFLKWTALILIMSVITWYVPVTYATENIYEIHVSIDGDDKNDGSKASPLKTLTSARDLYRSLKSEDENFRGKILVHGGIYRLKTGLTLNSQDSGMTIKAYGDGEVLIRGSVKLDVSMFKKVSDDDFIKRLPEDAMGNIYEIELSRYISSLSKYPEYTPLLGGTAYYELFDSGIVQNVARWPNSGFAYTKGSYNDGLTFGCNSSRLEKWKNSQYGMVAGYWVHDWAFENIYIGDIDTENSTVTLSKALTYGNRILSNQRYYAMNMPEEMDIPGEYYIDCDTKKLYYYPDGNFYKNDIELSVLSDTMLSGKGASDITVSGLIFEYARGNGISFSEGSNICISDCVVRNIGNRAITVSTTDSIIKNCELYSLGGGGVSLSGGDRVTLNSGNSKVFNNNIYNFGRIFRTYQAGIMVQGVGNTASYNTIHDAPHNGMRFVGNDLTISHNEIYNVVLECSDSGAIYGGNDWKNWGVEISENYFHDIKKKDSLDSFSVSAVYVDDIMTGTAVKNNCFKICTQAALFGGGSGNEFSGNIIVECDKGINYDQRGAVDDWEHYNALPGNGDTAFDSLEAMRNTIGYDESLWIEKYPAYKTLIDDMDDYKTYIQSGETGKVPEIGCPKNGIVKNNICYGESATEENFFKISEYVPIFGDVSQNSFRQETQVYTIPDAGADFKQRNCEFTIFSPLPDNTYKNKDIEFVWSRAAGADRYEVTISDSEGNVIENINTVKNGLTVELEYNGVYLWTVTAYNGEKCVSENGKFEVCADSNTVGTFIAGTDFEDVDLNILKSKYRWSFSVGDGDELSIEKDDTGNSYLRMVRAEENLMSSTATYASLDFDPGDARKITVIYDIMLENYRGGWRDMGSVQSSVNGAVMRILTHSKWGYCINTSGFNFSLYNCLPDSYITVKRVIDLDNNSYSIQMYQNGIKIANESGTVKNADSMDKLSFVLQYQSPYEPYESEGDGIYRIDNVYIDAGEIAPAEVSPKNNEYNVSADSEIKIKWNTAPDIQTINKESVSVYENGEKLDADLYELFIDGKIITINVIDGLKKDSCYSVVLTRGIEADNEIWTAMQNDYSFTFVTEKNNEFIYIAEGFEEYEPGQLTQNDLWTINVADGDNISVEEDECGSKALKFVRAEKNLESSISSSAEIKLPEEIKEGKLTVSYDVRIENYRGGICHLGTVSSAEKSISRLFTHSAWMYGVNTSGYNVSMVSIPNNKYLTVKREIDYNNGKYSIIIYNDDGSIYSKKTEMSCGRGEPDNILFENACQSPYKIYNGTGDSVFWIDNIRVDSDAMQVYKTFPEKNSTQESVVKILFNADIDPKTVTKDNITVYKYSCKLNEDEYNLTICGNMLVVNLLEAIENGASAKVKISSNIMPKNAATIKPMREDYELEFNTEEIQTAQIIYTENFEEWGDFRLDKAGKYTYNGWCFELYDGDSVCIETDSATGNRSLKLVKGTTSSEMKVYMQYKMPDDELIGISFDTSLDNQSRRIHDWGSVKTTSNKDFLKMVVYDTGYWHMKIGDTKRFLCGLNSDFTNVEEILNPIANEYTVNIWRDGTRISTKSDNASYSGIPDKLVFSVSNINDDYKGKAEGDGIYRIDNVVIRKILTPKVLYVKTDNMKNAWIVFDRAIASESVNKNNIKIYEDDVLINTYLLSCDKSNSVKVTFNNGMIWGHKYRFELDEILSTSETEILTVYENELQCDKVFEVVGIENISDVVSININTNMSEYVCIAAKKDNTGKLLSVQVLDKDESDTFRHDCGSEEYEYYFWESMDNMIPITTKK